MSVAHDFCRVYETSDVKSISHLMIFFFFFCCHDKQTDEIEMDEKLTPQPLTLWHISERSYTVCFRTTPRNAQKFRNLAISVADQFHVIWYVNQEMFCVSSLFLYIILHACTHTAFLV